MTKHAVVTLVMGDGFEAMARLTVPFMRMYAKARNADFLVIDTPRMGLVYPHFEKWQMFDLFDHYDRLAFFDCDVLLDPLAPDIFARVPAASVGGYDEGVDTERGHVVAAAQEELGIVPWRHGYLNSGVGVYAREHRALFDPADTAIAQRASFYEQTTYNHRIARHGFPVERLTWRWNCMDACGKDRSRAYAVHYAGTGFTDAVDTFDPSLMRKKLERVTADIKQRFG